MFIALSRYLGKESLWRPLAAHEKDNLANWLSRSGTVEVPRNQLAASVIASTMALSGSSVRSAEEIVITSAIFASFSQLLLPAQI